ncbi:MAG: hypothetical protein R2940_13280 [Syntrophotaleaceae bacterium]
MMLDALAFDSPARLPRWKRLAELDRGYHIQTRHRSDLEIWVGNDGFDTLESYGVKKEQIRNQEIPWDLIPLTHVDFLAQTKLWYREGEFLFVHAGAIEGRSLAEQKETLLWERYCPPGKAAIHVVGHHPTPDGEPYFEAGRYSIDTGAAYGRKLTACDVLTRKFWQE